MRSLIPDMPNGRELMDELDLATVQMMAISVELIGTDEWQDALDRQRRAFKKWRDYLHRMAGDRVRIGKKQVA